MTANFFRHLEEEGVEWLLVSGQATILYGAATFSEDIDLWVNPTASNFERLARALRRSQARYYKLTPPLRVELAHRHHGFHFVLPEPETGTDAYLDVMGCPPRVGAFEQTKLGARLFETDWGRLATVGIPDLVEIKKTQRARDYPIISRLALAFMRDKSPSWSDAELQWAVDNIFSLSELIDLFTSFPVVGRALDQSPPLSEAFAEWSDAGELSLRLEDELTDWFDTKMSPLRKADRAFWRDVIHELRELRAQGALMNEGTPV